jgi:phage major head subunit gpT-like protein
MDLNSANLTAIFTGYKTHFQQGLDSLGDSAAYYTQFCTVVPSTNASEVYPFLGGLPNMRPWVGDRVIHSLEAGDFTIKNRKFELTHGISRDSIDDDTFGLYGPIFKEQGRSTSAHPNQLAVEVLEKNPDCYDGQPLFDADHKVLDADGNEVSVSNDMGGAGDAWYVMDLSRAIHPLIFQKRRDYAFRALDDLNSDRVFMKDEFLFGVDGRLNVGPGLWQLIVRSKQPFNAANYEAARKQLQTLKGDYARPLGLMHTHTMVPSSMEGEALVILNNENDAAGATNQWKGTSQLIVNPWLASA